MKNRTIAKLLVCSTILANLPVAAMANEVQNLANEPWYLGAESDGQNGYVYNVSEDSKVLWVGENQTYSIGADVAVKIAADKSVALGSNLENTGGNKITIEGNGTTSVFNMANKETTYTIDSDVTFKDVAVTDFTDNTENRAKVTIEGTVDINGEAVVTVTGADGANVTVDNASGDFANGAGLALVGDVLTVTPAEGYTVTVDGTTNNGDGTYTVTGAVTITVEKEESVWVLQEDGSYKLDVSKVTDTNLVVPASETTTTYTIPAGTSLDVTNVEVGKGSVLRIERDATFTQDVDFALGGRLIAQTTTFKGQVWFTSYTSMARTASATTDGTAVVDGGTFEKAVTISVPTELTGTTKANAEVAVVSGAALTVSGTVEGQGSITSQGDLTVSGTVSTPVTVQAGTVNVTGTVPTIEVTGTASVTVAETANVDKIVIAESAGNVAIDAPSVPVEDNRKNGITYTVSVTGKGTLRYGANTLVNDTDSTQTKTVYAVADDTAVQLIMEPAEGYNFESLKVNDVAVETTKNTQGFDTYSVQQDANLKSIAATFVDGFIGGGGGSTGGGSTGGGSSTSGTTSTVTVSASTSVSGKIMTATVSASNMEKAVKDVLALAEKNNTTPVVKVSLSLGTSVEGISVNLPTEALKALAAVSNAKLTIESSVASVTFDANALSDVLSQAGETFTLNAGKADMSNFTAAQLLGAGEGSVYDINITSDGNAITNFDGGSATVTLPYALKVGENASDIVVYYMADNGILDSQSTQYDAANRKATFTTSHFSIYVVDAAWANPFNDVYEGDWFYNAVRYANENSLMAGVSDTTFAPNMNLTRAMVVQMLYSLEGKPAVVSGGNFSDVKASDWYADAVNWAASKGIVSGYSETTYAPNDSVTREQLSLILYKYAQSKNVTVNDYSSLSGFVDAAKTSDWAEDAVEWAVGAGLISSTSTSTKTLDPTGTATRAQVAQIVANFVEQVM